MPSVIARKAIDTSGHTPTSITDTSNVASIIPTDWNDVDIAMARIKTTGDILAVANVQLHNISNLLKKTSGLVSAGAGAASGIPFVGPGISKVVDVVVQLVEALIVEPIASIIPWLDLLAFYFGVFLPSLPYTIFIIAVIGWFLAVLQTVFAAPLWAVMHMTPDRTFVGSQTQGYLMFLSLFMRPVLIIAALFAAMLLANPIILYVSKAFWAMRTANVSSAESIGFYVQFLTWKNWLIMYGMILLPVVYMIYGLTNTLPDAILTWIGAGIKPLGETQASAEMRSGMERHGADSRRNAALGGSAGGAAAGGLPAPSTGSGGSGRGGAVPGSGLAADRLLSDTGQASVNQTPDHVPRSNASKTGEPAAQTTAASTAVGAGAALTTSNAAAEQAQSQDAGYTPQNADDRPMHNEAHVQEPDRAIHVGKDGEPLSDKAARTAGIGALLNADRANPSGTDAREPGAAAA